MQCQARGFEQGTQCLIFRLWLQTVIIITISSNPVVQQSQVRHCGMRTAAGLESTAQTWNDIFNFKLQIHLPKGGTRGTHKNNNNNKKIKQHTLFVDHMISGQQHQADELNRLIKMPFLSFLIICLQGKDLTSCTTVNATEVFLPHSPDTHLPLALFLRVLAQSSATADGNFQLGMCFRGNKEFTKVT